LHERPAEARVKYPAILATVMLAGAVHAAAQAPVDQLGVAQPPQSSVFRSGANLVALNVTVTDGKDFVVGLTPGDFAVYEDGIKQHVQFFEAATVPIDLVLLIDTSSSMRDKMNVVHEAALGFMKTLREGDRGAVIEFNDIVNITQELTSDGAALERAIQQTIAKGGTALNNALYIALKQFGIAAKHTGDVRRQAIAVLSDGNDTASVLSFDDVLEQARRSGVSVYTIALKSRGQHGAQDGRRYFSNSDYAMRTLATETGAQSFFPTEIRELKGIYATIAEELSSQYSIGYAPSDARPDGRFRRIVVRLTSLPGLTLRARSGYVADAATARRE
jgi:Ca-activated chloride channel homolog